MMDTFILQQNDNLFILAGSFFWSYVLAAVLFFVSYKRSFFVDIKIQKEEPSREQIIHEIKWSFSSIGVWFIMTYFLILAIDKGYTKVYLSFGEYSVGYFLFTVVFFTVLHDTYFYWVHRFMHSRGAIFHKIHATHHVSKNPTVLSIFSFDPYEAIILGVYFVGICFFIPIHIYAVASVFLLNSFANIIGHSGYEFLGKESNRKLQSFFLDSLHHNTHHKYAYMNYGIYFPFWDKLMGTFHQKYNREKIIFYSDKYGK